MDLIDNTVERLKLEEGYRKFIYQDSLGYSTVGYGLCIDSRVGGSGVTKKEAEYLLRNRVQSLSSAIFRAVPWATMLDIGRQQILIEMAYQMGGRGLMEFKRFLAALKEGNFSLASDEMLDSSWARDHTPARAKRLAARMLEDPAPTELSDEDLWGT